MTENKKVLTWLEEMKALVKPANVVWIDGSEEQLEALRAEAVSTGEMIRLNQEKLPGCFLHRTATNDVARVEDKTFICTTKEEDAGPTNNWMAPSEAYAKLTGMGIAEEISKVEYIADSTCGGLDFADSRLKEEYSIIEYLYDTFNISAIFRI